MSETYTKSGLMQKEAICEPYSVTEVEFFDVRPNYFRVQNFGAGKIYCGTTKIPTDHQYDFAVKADGVKMFAEPHRRSYVHIYNPTGTAIRVRVVAFYAEFDPLALAFSEMEFDFAGTTLETSTEISAFKSPLPSGTNKIGVVDVGRQDEVISLLTTIANKLTAAESGEY